MGHFVSDLSRIDFPINRGEIEPFPRSMQVHYKTDQFFKWEESQGSEHGGALGGGAPVLGAAGVPITAKADIKAVFKATVSSFEVYERLDTYLVQVNRSYIADCLENEKIAQHTKDRAIFGKWSMFVITGLKVARSGSSSKSSSRKTESGIGIEL
ncbi:hypothetical protein N0V92_002465 [Colletotrichum tropicale]|nr:hypothetical protein N0V92_002465 [Colletotrichum tropicale]